MHDVTIKTIAVEEGNLLVPVELALRRQPLTKRWPPISPTVSCRRQLPNASCVASEWAKRLNDQWDHNRETAVEGFVQLGRDLHAAKKGLKHGEWIKMLEGELNFNTL